MRAKQLKIQIIVYTPDFPSQFPQNVLLIFSPPIELAQEDILIPICPESFFEAKINKL